MELFYHKFPPYLDKYKIRGTQKQPSESYMEIANSHKELETHILALEHKVLL